MVADSRRCAGRACRLLLSLLLLTSVSLALADDEVVRRTANDGNVILEDVPQIPERIVESLRRYQSVRLADFQDWSEDGRALFITTRFGDTRQLHRVDMPGGERRQLTFFAEPVGSVARRPGHASIALTRDRGGSEQYQIYLLDPTTAEVTLLTDGDSRNGRMQWSDGGGWLAFQSTRRDGRSNDVWLLSPDRPEQASLIVEAPDGAAWSPEDFDADGSRLLVAQYISATDSRAWLVELASGQRRLLAGGGEPTSSNLPVAIDARGEGFFYLTNSAGQFLQLAWRPLAAAHPGAEPVDRVITSDLPWDVERVVFTRDGRRGAFAVNENGRSRLYLLDPASRRHEPVQDLPEGRIVSMGFSPAGDRLALTLDSATSPADVYVLALGKQALVAGELARWTYSEVGGIDMDRFVAPRLIHYPTFDEVDGKLRQIPAFVYRPRTEGPTPVIIYIHGGPEGQFRPGFSSRIQMWVDKLGVTVIAPNVRGSSGYGKDYLELDNWRRREDSVRDIGALLDWIGEQPDLDAERVAVYGGSYGGYMVLASAMHYARRLRAAVDIVGISNFVTFLTNTRDYRRDLRRVEYGDERDAQMRAFLESISPGAHPERLDLPLLVMQGLNDPRVPASESEQLVSAVRARGLPVWYVLAQNEGHGFRKQENRDLSAQIVVMFLERYLIGGRMP